MTEWIDPLGWAELLEWLAANAGEVRAGRLTGELVVTSKAYASLPGVGDIGPNPLGETVWRKKMFVAGFPTAKIALTVIDPAEGMMLG